MQAAAPFVLAFVPGVTPAKWVGVWKERMPRQPIEARPVDDTTALDLLRSGDAAVALVRLPIDDVDLSVIPLYWEKAVVVAPKDNPIAAFDTLTMADLAGETVLAGADRDMVELVAAGVGIAIMPQSVARAVSRRDVVSRIIVDHAETRIALAWVSSNDDPHIDEFTGIVRGRTANSSRGTAKPAAPPPKTEKRRGGRKN